MWCGSSSSLIFFHQVVYGDSAIISDAGEIHESIHGDHLGMVKFTARSDTGYKKVLNAIEILLEGLDDVQPGATDQSV
jgi:hypothetical protein